MTETVRARFFGGPGRDIHTPAMVETGAPDGAAHDDGRRVAAFAGEIELPPGGEAKIVVVFGQATSRAEALAAAAPRSRSRRREADLAATRASWAARLGKVEVRTNRPDFDRLVNTWLPYQLYASRLWGRVGPNQRGGATGFRDQLQDVLPLDAARAAADAGADRAAREPAVPRGRRAEMVASRARTAAPASASAPRRAIPTSGCPMCSPATSARPATRACSTRSTPFLEGEAVPDDQDTWIVIPRASRETATVYEHARLAIAFTLEHIGENGLPLLRAGDWNDGIDVLGRREIGTSVWMGFFLANVLDGFASARPAEGRRGLRRGLRGGARRRSARRSTSAGGATITRSTSPTTARFSTSRTR